MIILYTIYGLSLNIFIYTAYIRSIPIELEEAARMDGASTWRVFRSVIFPLLMPMNATVGILTCVWAWNDFIMPLVVLTDPSRPNPAAGAVRLPGAVQHRLHRRVRLIPDGDGTAADRLHLLAAVGHLGRDPRLHQVSRLEPAPFPDSGIGAGSSFSRAGVNRTDAVRPSEMKGPRAFTEGDVRGVVGLAGLPLIGSGRPVRSGVD